MTTKQQREDRTKTLLRISRHARAKGFDLSVLQLGDICDLLHRHEATLHRIAEMICSVEMTPGKENKLDLKVNRIEDRVRALLQPYGIDVRFNGDPRGGAIRMIMPDHESNNLDGETWGIYW